MISVVCGENCKPMGWALLWKSFSQACLPHIIVITTENYMLPSNSRGEIFFWSGTNFDFILYIAKLKNFVLLQTCFIRWNILGSLLKYSWPCSICLDRLNWCLFQASKSAATPFCGSAESCNFKLSFFCSVWMCFLLCRNEVVSLFQSFGRYSSAIREVDEFRRTME